MSFPGMSSGYEMPLIIAAAYMLDRMLGDPWWLPHPVRWMGGYISFLESGIRRVATGPLGERIGGVVLWITVCATVFVLSRTVLGLTSGLPYFIVATYLAYTTIAARSLQAAVDSVIDALENGDLRGARRRLSLIVGRDTGSLSEEEVYRAAIETAAENTSDGIIAPLFYLALGGPPLALLYKAVNTLDSMVGYRSERYRHFGWFSARADDVANFIPSRLTVFFTVLGALFFHLNWRRAVAVALRDGRNHPSPNAGYPEAAASGALGVQLGGASYYSGRCVEKRVIGSGLSSPDGPAARRMVKLVRITTLFAMMVIFVVLFIGN